MAELRVVSEPWLESNFFGMKVVVRKIGPPTKHMSDLLDDSILLGCGA